MTLEKLFSSSASELEAMTDAQLLEFFKPVLHITRPELSDKPRAKVAATAAGMKRNANMEMARHLAEQFGFKDLI